MNQNRRTFLKTSAIASAAVVMLPSCMSSTSRQMPDLGLQLYTVRNQMAEDARGTLERVAKIGYKNLETAGYADGKMYGFTGAEWKNILGELGLRNISAHMSLPVFQEEFDQALEFMQASDQQYVVLPWLSPEQRTSLDQYRSYAELLNKSAEKAQSANIQVCYHNHDFEFQELEGQLPINVLLENVDPKLVDLELDLYWVRKAGFDPVEFFKENENRIPLWHVKDMADTPEQGFAPVGTGTIDFKKIFDHAEVSGMDYFFVEQDQSDDPMQSIETSYKNLTQKILG